MNPCTISNLCRRIDHKLSLLSSEHYHRVRLKFGAAVGLLLMKKAGWTLTRSALPELMELDRFLDA